MVWVVYWWSLDRDRGSRGLWAYRRAMYTEYQIMLPTDLSSSRGSRPRHSTSRPSCRTA